MLEKDYMEQIWQAIIDYFTDMIQSLQVLIYDISALLNVWDTLFVNLLKEGDVLANNLLHPI